MRVPLNLVAIVKHLCHDNCLPKSFLLFFFLFSDLGHEWWRKHLKAEPSEGANTPSTPWNLGPTATHTTYRHSPDEAHQWNGPRRRALHSHNRLLSLPREAYSRHLIRCEDHFITPGLTINTSVGLSQGSGGKMWDELWQHLNVSLTGGCSQRSSWCSFHPLTVQPATAAAGSDASLAFRIPSFFNCHLCIIL